MVTFIIIAAIVAFIMNKNSKAPQLKEVDCSKHEWERNLEGGLYCKKCHRRPG